MEPDYYFLSYKDEDLVTLIENHKPYSSLEELKAGYFEDLNTGALSKSDKMVILTITGITVKTRAIPIKWKNEYRKKT